MTVKKEKKENLVKEARRVITDTVWLKPEIIILELTSICNLVRPVHQVPKVYPVKTVYKVCKV